MRSPLGRALAVAPACLTFAALATAQHNESEPNESKAAATAPGACLASGATLNGASTGTSTTTPGAASADYWKVQTCAAPPGIYRHRLTITTAGTAGHVGTIRGLNQTGTVGVGGTAGTTDTTIQTSSTATNPARTNQWYGFGKGEELYYRVTGTASTTAPYVVTLDTQPVTPIVIGPYAAGNITFTTVGQTTIDTDLWVYDANFNAIPGWGNDDHFGGTTLQSALTRNFAPGTYYLAISNYNVANNQTAPADDDFVLGALLDFPDSIANSSTTANLNVAFAVTDANGTTTVPATKAAFFDLVWFRFDVGGGSAVVPMCFGDGTQATPCPCGNSGAAGKGCDNSAATGGAHLTASGTVNPDTLVLTSTGELPTALSIFLQGDSELIPGSVFGDGVRCAGGNLKRLFVKNASGGTASAPGAGDPSISAQSAALGDPFGPGAVRIYQVYYRDPDLVFCPNPPGNSWNVSNGLRVTW